MQSPAGTWVHLLYVTGNDRLCICVRVYAYIYVWMHANVCTGVHVSASR